MRINNETARERLEDVRDLEPTSNSELQERWGMDSGSEVARYLREELGEYTYRNDDSEICARDDDSTAEEVGIDSDTDKEATAPPAGATSRDDSAPSNGQEDVYPSLAEETAESTATGISDDSNGGVTGDVHPPTGADDGTDDGVDETDVEGDAAPSKEAPDVAPDVATTDDLDDSPDDVDGCPDCGGELVDWRDTDEYVTRHGREYPTPFDYVCSECHTTFDYSDSSDSDDPGADQGSLFGKAVVMVGVAVAAAVSVFWDRTGGDDRDVEVFT